MGAVHAREAFPSGVSSPAQPETDTDQGQIALDTIKARVVSVAVDGLLRTKNDVVMDSVKDLFKVEQIIWRLFIIVERIFQSVKKHLIF